MKPVLFNQFQDLVLKDIPLIDVRAPIEYQKGAFQTSINLPIMDDEERRNVGTLYKEEGNEAATALGIELVSGRIKEERIEAWKREILAKPETMIYCFRGGSRSRFSQTWLKEEHGIEVPRLEGGYKAFRNYLIEALLPEQLPIRPLILGGYTGSGKTILLKKLENVVDLESIANHRGSSFGKHSTPQPSQINFENNLAFSMIKQIHKGHSTLIFEDEGLHVGTCYLPKPFYHHVNCGDLVLLEIPFEERVAITLEEYVHAAQLEYITNSQDQMAGMEAWLAYIINSITRMKKRLGDARMKELLSFLQTAYQHQLSSGDSSKHIAWISVLLKDYYDPMYLYQIKNTTKKIAFRGNESEVFEYLLGASKE